MENKITQKQIEDAVSLLRAACYEEQGRTHTVNAFQGVFNPDTVMVIRDIHTIYEDKVEEFREMFKPLPTDTEEFEGRPYEAPEHASTYR